MSSRPVLQGVDAEDERSECHREARSRWYPEHRQSNHQELDYWSTAVEMVGPWAVGHDQLLRSGERQEEGLAAQRPVESEPAASTC
jgi:hypothetical protein